VERNLKKAPDGRFYNDKSTKHGFFAQEPKRNKKFMIWI